MDITKIDKNFCARSADENGFIFCDVKNAPFVIEGLAWYNENNGAYYRLPKTFTGKDVNAGALDLSNHTAGVCVRFKTDSPEIMLRAKLAHGCDFNHMPRTGTMGFDLFFKPDGRKFIFNHTVQPGYGATEVKALAAANPDGKFCEWLVNFPLYGGVEQVEIGLKENCRIAPPKAHKNAPVLFYGSSITQGGCASRPGNAYTSMLCRAVDAEQINLGFSGCGKGEEAVAEAIAKLKLSAFVMDYDHNAPTVEHLENTHSRFFSIIRKAQPDLPVIMLSKPDFPYFNQESIELNSRRRDVVKKTYLDAVAKGDENVYFIDGQTLFAGENFDLCTVDGCHPNDLGFYRMYRKVLPVLRKCLGR
ncbi:MAG: hypothetical protein E7051_06045 [Lentisphaerae bacterium]|nr:hypothetical protein [Lentisphaerota bacterium]